MLKSLQDPTNIPLQVLQYLGWDFVSLVVSSDEAEYAIGASALHTVAKAARVCVGLELSLSSAHDNSLVDTEKIEEVGTSLLLL